ncbi:unnamed protein product [Calicophoron daubneyi]|uniref:Nuclear autoantigenic sperm protein n=1 Tax=Calicophoron daubneyi TaxID=300641 RepID=A0AAV2TV32_CALDB
MRPVEFNFVMSEELLVKGRRSLICGEIAQAVESFQKACEMISAEYGDLDDRLGDPNLLYGTALLELARMESTVIGNALEGVPEEESATESEDEMVEEGPEMTAEEKEDLSNKVLDAMCEQAEDEVPGIVDKSDEKTETDNGTKESKTDEQSHAEMCDDAKPSDGEVPVVSESGEGVDSGANIVETKEEKDDEEADEVDEEGDQKKEAEQGEEDKDDTEKEDDQDEITNLQLAWEVIEVAKKIFSRKTDDENRLKVAECLEKLAEISREKEDYTQALADLTECLSIRSSILSDDNREIAETHFQLGTTHAVAGDLEQASCSFMHAIECLKRHAENLKKKIPTKDDGSEEKDEINALRSSLKEVESLITDVEKRRAEVEEDRTAVQVKVGESSGVPQKSDISEKPAGDISHLIRKKRVALEIKAETNGHPTELNGNDKEIQPPKKVKLDSDKTEDSEKVNGVEVRACSDD